MKLLLDTHVFLWLNGSPDKLSDAARQACEDPGNSLHLSLASAWEIQIKHQLGKLQLDAPWQDMIKTQQQDNGLAMVPIELAHVAALANLPPAHRDPFDRMIISQASMEGMTVVTADQAFAGYPVPILWGVTH